ncbi:MAG: GCN5-related N-acetyltransferase [Proteobacteria bacterium]|nr:GCN5-related N-acetyltransferase [Pseudomonadota bacterium]
METKPLQIREMRPDEIGLAIDWAAKEGWNPGLDDLTPFAAADPGAFLVGLLGENPVATISAVRYGNSFGFVGCYLVAPEFRGRGYGLEIWQAAMHRLAGRNIGLDGVVAQQDNYRRSGFRLAHRNIRFAGKSVRIGIKASQELSPESIQSQIFSDIERYDSDFFADTRSAFLRAWIEQARGSGLVVKQRGVIVGYGLLRACRCGYKFGPLFADSPLVAETLFGLLTESIPAGSDIYLDVPAINPEAVSLAERHGMRPVFETARMYTQAEPDIAIARTYGITTFELG